MKRKLKLFYYRLLKVVITSQKAKELNLKFYRNVYGDEINMINCRSVWIDENGKFYRVYELSTIDSDEEGKSGGGMKLKQK